MEHKGIKIIETDRLILRQIRISDAEIMLKNWVSDEVVTRYLMWSAYDDIEKAKQFINFCIEANKNSNSYKWCIEHKNEMEIIGTIDVVSHSDRFEAAEIGYALSRRFWNKGIMSEALGAVIKYLIREVGFNRVCAMHHIDNIASGRVMQKCGMKFEGVKRQAMKDNKGNFCDVATYAIIKDDLLVDGK